MRGSPPLQLALILIGFLLLGIPLVALTSGRETMPAPVAALTTSYSVPTLVRVRWAHRPTTLSLWVNGKPLLAPLDLALPMIEGQAELLLPKEGIEIALKAEWPAGTPDTAVTLELEPDERDAQTQTRWSSTGKLAEIIPFQWK
jgi:hypothetical protein